MTTHTPDTSTVGASTTATVPLFVNRAEVRVAADPETVYALVTDLGRSGEWSPECTGGAWIGEPAQVGSVFRGENYRAEDVVGWAPLIRGEWTTEAEVVVARQDREFRWAMRDKETGRTQQSVWGFVVTPEGDGSVLAHEFQMDEPTEGIRKITKDMGEEGRARFIVDWGEKIQGDLVATLDRIKEILEKR